MTSSIVTEPPNNFVAITEDVDTAELPATFPTKSWIAATSSCIYAGCNSADGDVTIVIGPERQLVSRELLLLHDGVLETPHGKVGVWTTEWKQILKEEVPTRRTRVRIWGNHENFRTRW
jgi:hypothetical protein